MRGPAITLSDTIAAYRRVPAVHHVSGTFAAGSMTAVAGPNGAGKSTLLKAIMGLAPFSGRIDLDGLSPDKIAYLPQLSEIDRSFPLSVLQTALMGAWPRCGAWRAMGADEIRRAQHAVARAGLAGYAGTQVAQLSTGQWHRALFARLIVQDAPVILLDEPFSAVDEGTTEDLMALVHSWHGEGRTIVAVLHDMGFVRRHFPDLLLIAREVVAWGATAEVATDANIERAAQMTRRWAREEQESQA